MTLEEKIINAVRTGDLSKVKQILDTINYQYGNLGDIKAHLIESNKHFDKVSIELAKIIRQQDEPLPFTEIRNKVDIIHGKFERTTDLINERIDSISSRLDDHSALRIDMRKKIEYLDEQIKELQKPPKWKFWL